MSGVRAPGRVNRVLAGGAKRLSNHTTLLGLVVLAVGLFLGYIAWISINGVPFQNRYTLNAVIPADSPIVKEGDTVRVAGRLAGFITGVEPYQGNVKIQMEVEPSYAPVGEDAKANVRVRSITYLTYIELIPGDTSRPLPEGGTIPLDRTGSGTDLLEVVQLFDRKARDALRQASYNAGIGLSGRGDELNVALGQFPELADNLNAQLHALTSEPGAVGRLVSGLARTASGLRGVLADDPGALIASSSAVVGAVAARSEDLARAIDLARPVEDEFLKTAPLADPLLAGAADLARSLKPAVSDLAAVLPEVNRTLATGDELRTQVARLTAIVNPILAQAAPILRALRPTVASLGPLAHPLNRLVDTLNPYAHDIHLAGVGLRKTETKRFPEGETAPNNPGLRFSPVITCHSNRIPYPDPGEPLGHSQAC